MTLIIFDCDGTLVDSEFLHAEVEVDVLHEQFGITTTIVEHNRRFCGAGLDKLCEWIEKEIGHTLPPDFTDQLSKKKIEAFKKKLKAIDHMQETLDEIASFPKCVASNTPLETVKTSLHVTGLYNQFAPNIFSAQMVSTGKPAPDLFLYAADQMKIKPEDCVVIEDSPHGITAALAANMRVFGFKGGSHCYPGYEERLYQAELLFDDIRKLPELLRQL